MRGATVAYYVLIGDDRQGPFGIETIDEMVRDGRIGAETYIWMAGMLDWAFADTVPEISALLRAAHEPPRADPPPVPDTESTAPARPARLSFGRTFGDAARIAARRPIRFLALICVLFPLTIASAAPTVWAIVTAPPAAEEAAAAQAPAEAAPDGAEAPEAGTAVDPADGAAGAPPPSRARLWIGLTASFALATLVFGGLCSAMLALARGRAADPGLLFTGVPRVFPLLIFAVSAAAATAAGAAVFALPGIFMFVCLILGPMILMDRHVGPFDAFGESFRMVLGLGWFRCFGVLLVLAVGAAAVGAGAARALCGEAGETAVSALSPDRWSADRQAAMAEWRAAFDSGGFVAAVRESPGAGLAAVGVATVVAAFAAAVLASMYEQGRPALERGRARRRERRRSGP